MSTRKKMKGERSLEIGGDTWGWKVGKVNVVIVSPMGKKKTVPISGLDTVTNLSRCSCGYDGCKQESDQVEVVQPSTIRKYIEANKEAFA